jgi:nicotinamidase-related amidase
MTSLSDRPHTALLVIDVQNDVVAAHNRDGVIANIATLVGKARTDGVPVIWVQHSDDNLPQDSHGWQYVPELTRAESEPLIHKQYGDSFEATDLEAVLAEHTVGHLIVTGAQTDACIRSTLHGAIVRGMTQRWSATRTQRKTTASGARRHRTRSSPTRTSTGSTRPLPDGADGRSRPIPSTSVGPLFEDRRPVHRWRVGISARSRPN